MSVRAAPVTVQLGARDTIAIVRAKGLPACIRGVADRIERDFARWNEFDKCARVAAHSHDGVIELMPVADATDYAFKYVNGHPRNPRAGLPTVMAFGVLADVRTGTPTLLAELTLVTAIRTAATSALAARRLARRGSRSMALIGNGAQAEFQAIAFRELLGIRELRLFDVDPAATAKLVSNLRGEGFVLRACASTAEAVAGADVVTTVTADKANATILVPSMVEPGMHVNAVGGDSPGKTELHRGVLEGASVFVEYEPQTRIEGDVQQMPADFPVVELWRVLAGEALGRQRDDEVTVFDSVGFALEDYSALAFMRDAAAELGIGTIVELVPQSGDPKDLFGTLRDAAPRAVARAAMAEPA
jgi:ornithine cyclodeaminase